MNTQTINGVTFQNWAAACGQLTRGMEESVILEKLGIELPVWQQTMEQFTATLGDPEIIGEYTAIFSNPDQGVFAGGSEGTPDADAWKQVVTDYNVFAMIQHDLSSAAAEGQDTVTVLKEKYNLSLGEWSAASMAMMQQANESNDIAHAYEQVRSMENTQLIEKYFPTYADFIRLDAQVLQSIKKHEKENGTYDQAYIYDQRETLDRYGIEYQLYDDLINYYRAYEQERMASDPELFVVERQELVAKYSQDTENIPNVNKLESDSDGLASDISL